MAVYGGPDIVTDGLVLHLDAANTKSYDDCELLLHMDGANNSTTFTDSSKNNFTVTANGNAKISTAQSKFGGASGYFDGTGDFLSFTSATSTQFGASDWTIEGWLYPTASGGGAILSNTDTWQAGRYNLTCGQPGQSRKLQFYANSVFSANIIVQSAAAIPLDTWTHFAVTRLGSSFAMFINGVLESTATRTSSMSDPTGIAVRIGATDGGSQQNYTGYIDDLRITKGRALYTSNFTPPSSAHRNSNTWYDLSGNSNNGTLTNGATYSSIGGGSMVFDGSNDYVGTPIFYPLSTFSILAFIRKTSNSNYRMVFSSESYTGQSWNYRLYTNINDGRLIGDVRDSTGLKTLISNYTILNNQWYGIAYIKNATNHYLYVNGSLVSSSSISTNGTEIQSNSNIFVGASPYLGNRYNFHGEIPQVLFYNKSLLPQEVQQNYLATKGRYGL